MKAWKNVMKTWRGVQYNVGLMLRETGISIERGGMYLQGDYAFRDERNYNNLLLPFLRKSYFFLSKNKNLLRFFKRKNKKIEFLLCLKSKHYCLHQDGSRKTNLQKQKKKRNKSFLKSKMINVKMVQVDCNSFIFVFSKYFKKKVCRHRRLNIIADKIPMVKQEAWIAPNSALIGNVTLGEDSTIWYGAVIRGIVFFRNNMVF